MIQFFVDQPGSYGIQSYLEGRGAALADTVVPVEYESIASRATIGQSAAIFAAVDQIGPTTRSLASSLYHRLRRRGMAVLNDAGQVLRRYELLQALYAAGVNTFRAVRASDMQSPLRYPVFVRHERQHDGSLTPLLESDVALERAITALTLRGRRRADLLIVEFCDTRDDDGFYRKYSAFRIGDRLVPSHVHISPDWMSKSGTSRMDGEAIREEARYFQERPHDRWLWDVFRLARVEYGRIDYGVRRGVPQAWEINTNPTVGHNPRYPRSAERERHRSLLEPVRQVFHQQFVAALRALDSPSVPADLPIVIDSRVRRSMNAEQRAARRIAARVRRVQRVIDATPVQRLRRVLEPLADRATRAMAQVHLHTRK